MPGQGSGAEEPAQALPQAANGSCWHHVQLLGALHQASINKRTQVLTRLMTWLYVGRLSIDSSMCVGVQKCAPTARWRSLPLLPQCRATFLGLAAGAHVGCFPCLRIHVDWDGNLLQDLSSSYGTMGRCG